MSITVEERVMIALIDYINAKPEHHNGLCYYLGEVTNTNSFLLEYYDFEADFRNCMPYSLIPLARKKMPAFGPVHNYITTEQGPTKRRIQFAKALLKFLEQGNVYYCTEDTEWKLA